MLAYAAVFFLSVFVSSLLTWGVRSFARRYGFAQLPQCNRHIHKAAIPRLGGLAIFASFVAVFCLYSVLTKWGLATPPLKWRFHPNPRACNRCFSSWVD